MTAANSVHVDQEKLDDLRALERPGKEGFLARILGVFLTDARKRVDEISRATEEGEPEALAMAAHALKSSAYYVGAHRLAEMCRQVEELAEHGVVAPEPAMDLRQELDAVSAILSREVDANGGKKGGA